MTIYTRGALAALALAAFLAVGGCDSGHGPDTLFHRPTYSSTTVVTECVRCHSVAVGTRRQIMGAGGDFGANAALLSHHVSGTSDPSPAQCQICHDLSRHMQGTVLLRNADTGSTISYDAATPSTLEPFCLSCHDANGAGGNLAPFADGRTLGIVPNTAGDKIATYWNAAVTVHKNNGLSCAGSGAPSTGCHGRNGMVNAHGSASKGLLTRMLSLPVPSFAPFDYDQYKLCFDCHESYPAVTKEVVLGYRQGGAFDVWWAPSPYATPTSSIRSLFRDQYIFTTATGSFPGYWGGISPIYNDNFFADVATPLHNYHLSPTDGPMQEIWNYRGQGEFGRASCVTCHNVHGTNASVRSTFEEFGLSRGTGSGPDEYVSLTYPGLNNLQSYPINCAYECHSIAGPSYYWYTPVSE